MNNVHHTTTTISSFFTIIAEEYQGTRSDSHEILRKEPGVTGQSYMTRRSYA